MIARRPEQRRRVAAPMTSFRSIVVGRPSDRACADHRRARLCAAGGGRTARALPDSLVIGDGLDGPSRVRDRAGRPDLHPGAQPGRSRSSRTGELLPTPFADLPSEDTGDRGLIGIAFDPDFGVSNHYVYFYYTGHDLLNHLVRFSAAEDVGTDGPFELFRTSSPSTAAARRRQHPVRAGRQALLRGRRQRLRAERPGPEQPAREDPADQQGRLDPGRQPVRRPARQAGRDLGVRVPQPVAVPVRQRDRAALRRRRRRLQLGGAQPHRQGRQLRLAAEGGRVHVGLRRLHRTRSTPIRTTARARRSPAARSTAARHVPDGVPGATSSSATTPRASSRRPTSTPNGNVTAVHDFDDAGRQRRRPEGRARRLAVLPHVLPGALYRVSYNTTSHLPVASASADVTKGIEPLTVHFSSAGSHDPDGDPLSYHWTFGDGTTSTRAEPDEDLHRQGRLHRAPDGLRRPATRSRHSRS